MATTISQFVPVQPGATQYLRGKYPAIFDFVEAYYAWLETSGQPLERIMILKDQRDIDKSLDEFVRYFHAEYLENIPITVLADKRKLAKHIKDFYKSRGSEKSFKFLFRILYNSDVDFYYPKQDILRISDGKWTIDTVIRTTTNNDTSKFVARQIKGLSSGAVANVENVVKYTINGNAVSEIFISKLNGNFTIGETVEVVLPDNTVAHETTYGLVTGATITDPGAGYKNGDILTISGGNQTGILAVDVVGGEDSGRVQGATNANFPQPAAIKLSPSASTIPNYYTNMFVEIVSGSGAGQVKRITSYNSSSHVAVIDGSWSTLPDITSQYRIQLGKIKTVKIRDFGINYTSNVAVDFSGAGNGTAAGTITYGAVGRYAGRYANSDGFLSNNKYIQDSFYYQAYSYVLKASQAISEYRNAVKTLLHPASLALFGTVIVPSAPVSRRSHTGTSKVTATTFSGSLPTLNLLAQYSCLENIVDDQKVFDISAAYPNGYNALIGALPTSDLLDADWVSAGVHVKNKLVNASYVPVSLASQTVIVVAKADSLTTNAGVIGCIDMNKDSSVSGFQIILNADGSLSFRVQKMNGTRNDLRVSTSAGVVDATKYFFAALRYGNNTLSGNLNQNPALTTTYSTNVDATSVLNNSLGYYLGTGGFYGAQNVSSLSGQSLAGGTLSGASSVIALPSSPMQGFFDGTIAYAIIYNRYLTDSEISDAYQFLKQDLASRSITLY